MRDLNENERKNLDQAREEVLALGQEQAHFEGEKGKAQLENQV